MNPRSFQLVYVALGELHLDLRNPRLGVVESSDAALRGLIDLNPHHFRTLMRSIRDHGLDPGDSLYVIERPGGGYEVLEGNRRVAALQALHDPGRLASLDLPSVRHNFLAREAHGFNVTDVEPVSCVLFPSREAAKPWIRRRHTGTRNGDARIPWRPLESQRFDEDFSVADVIEFVSRHESSDEERRRIEALLSRTSSTLERMIRTATCQELLRLGLDRQGEAQIPTLGVRPEKAAGILRRLVKDIDSEVVTSRSMDKLNAREQYFADLPAELRPTDQDVLARPVAFREVPGVQASAPQRSRPKPASPSPGRGTKLATPAHRFDTTKSTKLAMLAYEAERLPVRHYRFACALVLRTTVDLAVNDYMKTNGLPLGPKNRPQFTLRDKASRVLKHLRVNGSLPAELRAFDRYLIARDAPCSIQALGDFAHNEFSTPTADALQAAWDSLVPLLIATYGEAKG